MGEFTGKYPSNIYLARVLADIAESYDLKDIFYLDLAPFALPFLVLTNPELATQVQTSANFDRAAMLVFLFLSSLRSSPQLLFATSY